MQVWSALKKSIEQWRGEPSPPGTPLVPPLFLNSAFEFESRALREHFENPLRGHRYLRDSSPNAASLERALDELHPGFAGLVFSSGMAAISTVLFGLTRGDVLIVQDEMYRKTRALGVRLSQLGVEVIALSRLDTMDVARADISRLLVLLESPSNPHLRLVDVQALRAQLPAQVEIYMDATFAGLGTILSPLGDSLDGIFYSLTKYIGGHNDVIGGAALVKPDRFDALFATRSEMGSILDPLSSFLVMRSLETFDLRFSRQVENATNAVEKLFEARNRGRIDALYYPGCAENADQKHIFKAYFSSGGAVLSFVPRLQIEVIERAIDSQTVFSQAPSFGSNRCLIEIPSKMSFSQLTPAELESIGIEQNLVRASIGIDSFEEIAGALDAITGEVTF